MAKNRTKKYKTAAHQARSDKERKRRRNLAGLREEARLFVAEKLKPVISLANASHLPEDMQLKHSAVLASAVGMVSTLGGYAAKDVRVEDGPAPFGSTSRPGLHYSVEKKSIKYGVLPRYVSGQELKKAIATADTLLSASGRKWDGSLIAPDMGSGVNKLRAHTTPTLDGHGGVSMVTTCEGQLAQLVGLSVGLCHASLFREVVIDYLGRCANPACGKWYLSDSRKVAKIKRQGNRRYCCDACATAARQLEPGRTYDIKPCTRCSP